MTQNTEQNMRTQEAAMIDQYVEGAKFGWVCCETKDFDAFKKQIERKQKDRTHSEARGAEEQRRKDAEGQEPSAYVKPIDFYDEEDYERSGIWSDTKEGEYTLPLYTRPANVAALEARIAELEEALKEIIDTAGADCIHGLGPYIKIAQAALKRTGTPS